MKLIPNLNRQSVLSILLGISLGTFGLSVVALFYNMFEKEDHRKKYMTEEYIFTIKVPAKYVSAVIGKGGSVIKNIEELTDTSITVEKGSLFSSDRTCIIQSDSNDKIGSATDMIFEIIENYPEIETYVFFVPFEASGRVFSRNRNEYALEIQKSCGAKVTYETNVRKTATGLMRKVTLEGKANQIRPAFSEIIQEVERELKALLRVQMQFPFPETHIKDSILIQEKLDIIDKCRDGNVYKYFLPYETSERIIRQDGFVEEMERFSGAYIIDDKTLKYEGEERKVIIICGETEKQVKLAYSMIAYNMINSKEAKEALGFLTCSKDAIKEISESSSCNNDSSTSNNILNPILQQDGLMDVYVSAVKSPSLFWIQVIGPANDDLQHLIEEMTEYYDNEKNREIHSLKKITEGQMVAAKFPYDGRWYRAEVISIVNSTMCQVVYVDYGDVEIISKNYMFELRTDMLSLRQQAVECSLANVEPQEETWNIKVTEKFTELVHLAKWKPLVAKVKGYKERSVDDKESRRQSSMILCIDLYDKATNKNIGDELIQLGLAQTEEETYSAVNPELSHDKYMFKEPLDQRERE